MGLLLFILLLVGLNAIVSFAIAAVVRSNVLCIISSVVATEGVIALYGLNSAAGSREVHDVLLAMNISLILSTPVIVGTSVGFVVLARRLYRGQRAPPGT